MKTSAKSSKRRLKKSVRRTFGGVCLASAIMVAAIPFPDAVAYDPAAEAIPVYGVTSSDYITDINFYVDNNINGYPNTDTDYTVKPASEKKKATIVSKTSDAKYQLDWQYQYWTSTGADGYITGYNPLYQVRDTELGSRVYYDYVYVSKEDVQKFYEDSTDMTFDVTVHFGDEPDPLNPTPEHTKVVPGIETLGYVYELDGVFDITNPEHKWLNDHPQFAAEIAAYNEAYNAWVLDPTLTKPLPVTHKLSDIYTTDDARVQYFCRSVFGDGTDIGLADVAKRVYDTSGDALGWETVYVPKVLDESAIPETRTMTIGGTFYSVDSYGFLSVSYDTIIGISSMAFYGVGNIDSMTIANEVAFIGDSAFEKCSIKKVVLPDNAIIGNRAFRESLVSDVTIPDGVNKIGAEAFYGCPIAGITIPDKCTYIGPGAFANSASLMNVVFSVNSNPEKEIAKYAFYNDLALAKMDFQGAQVIRIGEAALAVNALDSGAFSDFTFPSFIATDASHKTEIGKYCLAGRMGLKNVTFPDNLHGALDDTIFYGCANLGSVTFGESCYDMTFNSSTDGDSNQYNTMFYTVTNPNFYVRGPKLASNDSAAEPRQSAWRALYDYNSVSKTGRHVPYVYMENGNEYYEVSDGDYLMVIDKATGELTSCTFLPTPYGTVGPIDEFVIPAEVGTTAVSGIRSGCFDGSVGNTGVLDYIVNLVIEDGSAIATIDSNTFNGADLLETVYIGDSVQSIGSSAFEDCSKLEEVTIQKNIREIGAEAFQNCPKLEDIYFETPSDFTDFFDGNIGENAFNTLGDKLILHGEIATGYAPFEWATNPDNYANKSESIRALYKTPAPTSLSVILDNGNNLATLVDYPHYEYLNQVMYDETLDELVELDASPDPSDPNYQKTILYKLDNNLPINYLEETMVKNCSDIVIPEGVESIDTYGFFHDSSLNPNGVEPYSNRASAEAYFGTRNVLPYESYEDYGLFNGYYGSVVSAGGMREYEDPNALEKDAKGNDRITSVFMNDVIYLPDGAFDDCENLQTVSLGSGIEEMGELPFSACRKLSSIACGNDNFVCNNGIIYENEPDGKVVVECLESRGSVVGRNTVSAANDPDLVEVKSIRPNAFADCEDVFAVDFTGVNRLDKIPHNCFDGCTQLSEIDIPENVKQIDKEAFAHTGDYTKVTVRNRNLFLGDDTNGVPGDKVKTSYYVTYEDALSRKTAENQDYIVELVLDDVWTVKYYDQTGRDLLGTEQVVNGKNAEGLDEDLIPKIEGYKFDGWNLPLKNITSDCFRLAMYSPINGGGPGTTPGADPGTTPGTTPGTNPGTTPGTNPGTTPGTSPNGTPGVTPGGNGSGSGNGNGNGNGSGTMYHLTVNYGSGSGDYAANTTVIIEAIDAPAGKVFDKWTVSGSSTPTIASATSKATTLKMPGGDCVVTATYKDASSKVSSGGTSRNGTAGGNGGSGNPNGNTGTKVDIRKPGISNVDKAYASVNGSTDNFIVKITESSEAANLVATALANKYGDMTPIKYFAMDISLYDATGTTKITNVSGLSVNVTMPLPDAMVQYAGNNRVGAVNGTTLEELPCKFVTVDGIPCVSFTATHFSPYTIYVDTNNMTYGIADSTPKTGDGIHPKWFASIGLFCASMVLFFKKDKLNKKVRTA